MNAERHTYEYWLGAKETKYSLAGVERIVRPSVTIRRARAVMEAVGVTKVTDVTDLDRVGIPNFMTVRPHDVADGISYYNGKGRTRADAHAGALMEAIERHASERWEGEVVRSSYYNLRDRYPCVDPEEILAPGVGEYSEDSLVEWVSGFDLLGRRATFVPLNSVVAPYNPFFLTTPLFYSSTNGLASGNSRLEALCHALCEVIERDALSLFFAASALRPSVADLLVGLGLGGGMSTDVDVRRLSLDGLPRPAAALVRKLQRAGLEVQLLDLTPSSGIPTIGCTIVDSRAPPTALDEHGGFGTHPDARIALSRALTEAAQTRLTFIQGGREDLAEIAPVRDRPSSSRCPASRTISFDAIASHEHPSINEDVEFMLDRLRQSGFEQVVAVDMTRAEVGIPVVRVVVPRAENGALFFMHTGRAKVGCRMLEQVNGPP